MTLLTSERVNEDLRMTYRASDAGWGLANSDPNRLVEFTAYSRRHLDTPKEVGLQDGLAFLLLESANDALRWRPFDPREVEEPLSLLARHRDHPEMPWVIEYWTALDNPKYWEDEEGVDFAPDPEIVQERRECWPVARAFRRALGIDAPWDADEGMEAGRISSSLGHEVRAGRLRGSASGSGFRDGLCRARTYDPLIKRHSPQKPGEVVKIRRSLAGARFCHRLDLLRPLRSTGIQAGCDSVVTLRINGPPAKVLS